MDDRRLFEIKITAQSYANPPDPWTFAKVKDETIDYPETRQWGTDYVAYTSSTKRTITFEIEMKKVLPFDYPGIVDFLRESPDTILELVAEVERLRNILDTPMGRIVVKPLSEVKKDA